MHGPVDPKFVHWVFVSFGDAPTSSNVWMGIIGNIFRVSMGIVPGMNLVFRARFARVALTLCCVQDLKSLEEIFTPTLPTLTHHFP